MIDRIRQTIEYSQLSASAFADTIGISRSGLTHLLTGRNQPSLDVARKILAKYPEISTEWLIMGMGEMLRPEEANGLSGNPSKDALTEPSVEHPSENSKFGTQHDLFGDFDNMDDSERDVEANLAVDEAEDELEFTEDEKDTSASAIETLHPAPVEESVTPASVPATPSRPRKPASEARTVPARRERHANAPAPAQGKKLQKIVFFYDDHSFEVYNG